MAITFQLIVIAIIFLVSAVKWIDNVPVRPAGFTTFSVHDIEKFVALEKKFASKIQQYLIQEEEKLQTLETILTAVRHQQNNLTVQYEHQHHYPTAAYALIKRFLNDWSNAQTLMNRQLGRDNIKDFKRFERERPTAQDWQYTINSILRLETVYNLAADDLIHGKVSGAKDLGIQLDWFDCTMIANSANEEKNFYIAYDWAKRALEFSQNVTDVSENIRKEIKRSLSGFAFQIGKSKEALDYIEQVLKFDPNDKSAQDGYQQVKKAIDEEAKFMLQQGPDAIDNHLKQSKRKITSLTELLAENSEFASLCRGEIKEEFGIRHANASLKCYYFNKSPILYLAPIPVEQVSMDPYIVIFYDIISDQQIEALKRLSSKKMVIAGLHNDDPKQRVKVNATVRFAKHVWLRDNSSQVTQSLSRIAQAVTGLNMAYSESLQVANYGIGGHYFPHYDYTEAKNGTMKARIATLMYYLSDVEVGGATAFPMIGVSVRPRKGSAVYWVNLYRNGTTHHYDTFHGGCPVLIGSKWSGLKPTDKNYGIRVALAVTNRSR